MRRSLSALVLGISLMMGSIAWAGYTFTHTALDPSRSEELADQMLENPDLRAALVAVLADRLGSVVPEGMAVPRQEIEIVADRTLDDPAVQLLLRDGLVQVHQKAVNGQHSDTTLHATAVGTVARNILVAERPELDGLVPLAPALRVELPTAGLSILGQLRQRLEQVSLTAALLAITGTATSLSVTRNRPMVLRRVATWAFGTAGFWLVVAFGIPRLIALLAPASGVVAGAIATVMFASMIPAAVALAILGGVALLGSLALSQMSRRRGARLVGRPNVARRSAHMTA